MTSFVVLHATVMDQVWDQQEPAYISPHDFPIIPEVW
jgi:hypothetical protein